MAFSLNILNTRKLLCGVCGNLKNSFLRVGQLQDTLMKISSSAMCSSASPGAMDTPVILSRTIEFENPVRKPVPVWMESLKTVENAKIGMIDLHPDVWTTYPRLDLLQKNIQWQRMYRKISLADCKSRADKRGGGRKPWAQKGTGRARHGSIRSPLWIGGGRAHGPHGPKSYFYMLPFNQRLAGLRAALSVKLAQNDLHFVDDLEIPSNDEQYLEDLAEQRNWGHSVLFVDSNDEMPENITLATYEKPGFTLMPTYGLNVYSMLKHETLVLSLAAAEHVERQLLQHMHSTEHRETKYHPGSGFNPSSVNYDRFTN